MLRSLLPKSLVDYFRRGAKKHVTLHPRAGTIVSRQGPTENLFEGVQCAGKHYGLLLEEERLLLEEDLLEADFSFSAFALASFLLAVSIFSLSSS